jgi:PIN domain nuclease of toxin-antitoxin system
VAATEALLLDTHVFLWACSAPQKLSEDARVWLADGATKLFVSVASLWEIAVKHESGLLHADARAVDASLRSMGIAPLAITGEHLRVGGMRRQRGTDPFDWLIAAQAVVEKLPVVSGDERLKGLGVEVRW